MLPPVPRDPVRPPEVSIGGEAQVRIAVTDGVELEGRIAVPDGATCIAVVAHPHPLYGGTMHNAVVVGVVKALLAHGIATLRFDYRGVGESTGKYDDTIGETDDVAAALAAAAHRLPGARVALAGYSFGSACAVRVVSRQALVAHPMPERVALIAPSPRLFGLDATMLVARAGADAPQILVVAPENDQYAARPDVEALAARLRAPVEVVPGDHFLTGSRRRVGDLVAAFFAALVTVVMAMGCGGGGGAESVADDFVDRVFVRFDQRAGLELARGRAKVSLERELRLVGDVRSANAGALREQPRVYYERGASQPSVGTNGQPATLIGYDLTTRTESGEVLRTVEVWVAQQQGVWRVTDYQTVERR